MITLLVKEYANAWTLDFITDSGRIFHSKTLYQAERPVEEVDFFANMFYPMLGIAVKVQYE